jgi:SAM-dependent methyltransferase
MTLWRYEISHANHRILDPFTEDKLMQVADLARLGEGQQLLDLACGRGEMLCRWAQRFGIGGLGIDLSHPQIDDARSRAVELGVQERVRFEQGDAGAVTPEPAGYDIVSCIGATWIGGGLTGTIDLMRPGLREGGLIMVGEPFWNEDPPREAYRVFEFGPEEYTSLVGTLDRLEGAGMDLVEMVVADHDDWDRYEAGQWWTTTEWLRNNPDDPRAPEMLEFRNQGRRSYLEYGRRYLGWGVFILRPAG